MNGFNLLQAIYASFYSKNLYREVAKNWGGKSILYLLFILTLAWIGATYQIQRHINLLYTANANELVKQAPLVTIKDGKIITPKKQPYLINAPASNEPFIIVDTSGKYKNLNTSEAIFLITDTAVITKPKKNEMRVYQIPAGMNQIINPIIINGYIKNVVGYTWIPIFIAMVIASFLFHLIKSLFYGIIGKIFSFIFGANLSYWQTVQIAMVAFTPSLVFATLIDFFNVQYDHLSLLCFVISMIYLLFGVIANKNRL